MATTATCTRFTDEYQLYEELGKYGARRAPRAAPRRPPRDPPALPGALCRRPGSPGAGGGLAAARCNPARQHPPRLVRPGGIAAGGKGVSAPLGHPRRWMGCPRSLPRAAPSCCTPGFLLFPLDLLRTRLPPSPPRAVSLPHVAVPFKRFCAGTRRCYCHLAMLKSPLPCPCERARCCCTALLPPSLRTCLCIGRPAAAP